MSKVIRRSPNEAAIINQRSIHGNKYAVIEILAFGICIHVWEQPPEHAEAEQSGQPQGDNAKIA